MFVAVRIISGNPQEYLETSTVKNHLKYLCIKQLKILEFIFPPSLYK